MQPSLIPSVFLALALGPQAVAQTAPASAPGASEEPAALDPIVVVSSRSPRPLSEVAAQVTVIDADDLQTSIAEDLSDVFRYQPGLEVETAGTRFGTTGINLRGVGGNRVAIEVDGVPVRDQFSVGNFSNGGRALVETDRVKRIEVLHGPASALYGSDAIGGVVAIRGWDPQDLLARSDGDAWLGLRAGYRGSDDSWVGSAVGAVGSETQALLAAATYRDGHELEHAATAGALDPQDWSSSDLAARWVLDTDAGQRFRVIAEHYERDATTTLGSLPGFGRFRFTTELAGDDEDRRDALSAAWEFSGAGFDQGALRAWTSDSDTHQLTQEVRARAPVPVRLERRFDFSADAWGVNAEAFREFLTGHVRHRIGVGGSWISSDFEELRDGFEQRLDDGSTSTVVLGESFPVRDFPVSNTEEGALFVQDEIEWADGRWELIPALRWDRYELDPEPDPVFTEDNPDSVPVAVSDDRVTPRVGLLFHPRPGWSAYAQYAQGFRAPPFADANIGLDIPLFNIRAIPNPDLRSETSDGIELGLRRTGPFLRWSLAAFDTDYDDFIESRVRIGVDPETGTLLFQSRNISSANIRGIDFDLVAELDGWHTALDGWSLTARGWWAEGENRENDRPLNSIAPPQVVLGLAWRSPASRWDAALNVIASAHKDDDDIDASDGDRFATPGWATMDLLVGWRPVDGIELRAGLYNLADRTYWRWLDVAPFDAGDPFIPLLSRPGRSVAISARLELD